MYVFFSILLALIGWIGIIRTERARKIRATTCLNSAAMYGGPRHACAGARLMTVLDLVDEVEIVSGINVGVEATWIEENVGNTVREGPGDRVVQTVKNCRVN